MNKKTLLFFGSLLCNSLFCQVPSLKNGAEDIDLKNDGDNQNKGQRIVLLDEKFSLQKESKVWEAKAAIAWGLWNTVYPAARMVYRLSDATLSKKEKVFVGVCSGWRMLGGIGELQEALNGSAADDDQEKSTEQDVRIAVNALILLWNGGSLALSQSRLSRLQAIVDTKALGQLGMGQPGINYDAYKRELLIEKINWYDGIICCLVSARTLLKEIE